MKSWNVKEYELIQNQYQFKYGKELADKLDEYYPLMGKSVADIGCGEGSLTNYIASLVGNSGSTIGVDLDTGLLELAAQKYPNVFFVSSGVIGWLDTFQTPNLDCIFSNSVLHWLQHYKALDEFFQKAHNALKPGGYGACHFSLHDNAKESKQFLEANLREFLGDSTITIPRYDYEYEGVNAIIEQHFSVVSAQEIRFQRFSEDSDLNFAWLISAQPILNYLTKLNYSDFIRFLRERWDKKKVIVKSHHCSFIFKKV